MAITVNKEKIIAEDIEWGVGTIDQIRGGVPYTYTRINSGIMRHTNNEILSDVIDEKETIVNTEIHRNDITNPHLVTAQQVGLENAENTADLDKVISTLTQSALNLKADKNNVLELDNATVFTPSAPYHPATQKYVDDKVLQTGAADMTKAVYDQDDSGRVDTAEALGDGTGLLGTTPHNQIMRMAQTLITDANTITDIGIYVGTNITNAPLAGNAMLEHFKGVTGEQGQRFIAVLTGQWYHRMHNGSSWNVWKKLTDTSDIVENLNGSVDPNAVLHAEQGKALDIAKVSKNTNQALNATDALSIVGKVITLHKGDDTTEDVTIPAITKAEIDALNVDADTLDSLNSTDLVRSTDSVIQTITGVKTFSSPIDSNVVTGTAPLTVASTTRVANLNADLLDGLDGSAYRNADNINAGTVNDARLPASISSDITGNAATVTNGVYTNHVQALHPTDAFRVSGNDLQLYKADNTFEVISLSGDYVHPSHPGDDIDVDTLALTGATVVSDIDINVTTDTLGHVTDANAAIATRTLTLADLGYDTNVQSLHATDALRISGKTLSLYKGDGSFESVTTQDTVYSHPTFTGDDINIDTTALTGATVISDLDFNITTDTNGHVTDANGVVATRTLTLADLGYTGDTDATNYVHPTHPGDDINIDTTALTGATVISDLDFNITTDTNGHVTDANATVATRTLTLADLGAASNSQIYFKDNSVGISSDGSALANDDSTSNRAVAIGPGAVATCATSTGNVGLGFNALNLTTGGYNSAIGYRAGQNNTAGAYNISLGFQAGIYGDTGDKNIAIGYSALTGNASTGLDGDENIGIGTNAGYGISTGAHNICVGSLAGFNISTGSNNVFMGYNAGHYVSTLSSNTSIGFEAGQSNATGNCFYGYGAGKEVSGNYNIASGMNAMALGGAGDKNIILGYTASLNTRAGDFNVMIGDRAGYAASTGGDNVGIGPDALSQLTDGYNNVGIGHLAGEFLQSGAGSKTTINSACIGHDSRSSGNNQVQLGDSTTTTYVYGTVQNRSDERDKADIRDTLLGLDFINKVRPVDYKWDYRIDYQDLKTYPNPDYEENTIGSEEYLTDLVYSVKDGSKKRTRYHSGVIAQELKTLMDTDNYDFGGYQDHSLNGGDDILSVGYDEFVAPLIKAVQELSTKLDAQALEIEALKAK